VLQDLGTLSSFTSASEAECINDSGQVVGYSENSAGLAHAFLYSDGSMRDLNNLIGSSQWDLESANGINDLGQICGYGVNPSGQTDAFLLTATPEPSTITLLAASGVSLLGYGLRRRRLARTARPAAFDQQDAPAIL
jgi:probable HAF family extracellular repeat protein